MKLENKVPIVTAARRGIGRSIAVCLAEEGADVVVNSYSEDTTARTAEEVPQSYSAMKAGLISYTQSLAERLGPSNINVNCVCPGIVYTDDWANNSKRMVEDIPEFQGQDVREWFVGIAHGKYPDMFSSTPLRREQMVEDIGRAVVYLVSEDAMNITGQSLNVDGGMFKN